MFCTQAFRDFLIKNPLEFKKCGKVCEPIKEMKQHDRILTRKETFDKHRKS